MSLTREIVRKQIKEKYGTKYAKTMWNLYKLGKIKLQDGKIVEDKEFFEKLQGNIDKQKENIKEQQKMAQLKAQMQEKIKIIKAEELEETMNEQLNKREE